jgi:hypothetical protein
MGWGDSAILQETVNTNKARNKASLFIIFIRLLVPFATRLLSTPNAAFLPIAGRAANVVNATNLNYQPDT